MPSHRHDRAAGTLRREVSRILAGELRDPAAVTLFVTAVALAPDKRSARILVAPPDARSGKAPDPAPLEALARATPFIRKTLAQRLRMRHVPDLLFEYDLGEQHSQRIDDLLGRIRKRARKALPALLAAAALQLPDSAAAGPALERMESSAGIMGSEFRIACYAPTRKVAAGAITAAFNEVRRVDELLSDYKPTSELSRLNREAGRGPVAVSGELAGLLADCLRYSAESEGAFDVTVGALVAAWGFHKGGGSMPSGWALWRARRNSGYRHLELDRANQTVRYLRSGLRLDPGAIGKGYAVDRAVDVLREYGIERALVSSGTSSVYAMGAPPDEADGWRLDLRAPQGAGPGGVTVRLRDKAVSTSGSYEKFFEEGGKRYGHILDPRTGRPAEHLSAVSVITPRAIDSEAWSTALFVNGAEWAREHPVRDAAVYLCTAAGACGWLDGRPAPVAGTGSEALAAAGSGR